MQGSSAYPAPSGGGNTANGNGNGNVGWGFDLRHSDDNVLTDNTANSNDASGFAIWRQGSGNHLEGNQAEGNGDYGFSLDARDTDPVGPTGNELVGNTATDNGESGFYLLRSSDNTIMGNTTDGGSYGFLLTESHDNTISSNISTSPVWHGFSLWYSDGNQLIRNTADTAGFAQGFVLVDSDGNSFTDNDARGEFDACPAPPNPEEPCSGGFAMYEVPAAGSGNEFVGNLAEDNGSNGFVLGNVTDVVLDGNTATGNYHGILLEISDDNELTNNTADYNYVGFHVSSSNGNWFYLNSASHNKFGFRVWDSVGNEFTDNYARNAWLDSADRTAEGDNIWTNNDFKWTVGSGGWR